MSNELYKQVFKRLAIFNKNLGNYRLNLLSKYLKGEILKITTFKTMKLYLKWFFSCFEIVSTFLYLYFLNL